MPPETALSGVTVFFLGMFLGVTACAVTCMPFIGTWAFARAEGGRLAWRDTAAFLAGRLVAYTILGLLSGAFGAWFVSQLASGLGNLAIALAAIGAATWLAWPRPSHHLCGTGRVLAGLSPFAIGGALTLIPCAPLATLLASCAMSGSALRGMLFGLLFGAGALVTPMALLIPAAAGFGRHLRQNRVWLTPWLSAGGAAVLFILAKTRMDTVAEGLFAYVAALMLTGAAWAHLRRLRQRNLHTGRPIAISMER